MGVDLSGTTPADPSRPKGILELIQEGIAGAGGIGGVIAGVFTGIVGGLVGAVQGIAHLIGGLFGMSSRDMAAVDAARVAAENAIVDNLGDALDQLDEVQRAGGAYMDYPRFKLSQGGKTPHVLPLSEPMTLQEGTRWVPATVPLAHSSGDSYSNVEASYAAMATGSGYLELLEPGFWRIDFQAAVLQASNYYAEPAEVWCYVSPVNHDGLPYGAPGLDENGSPLAVPSLSMLRSRFTGQKYTLAGLIQAFGRASAYVDQLETDWSGGNTISGTVFALLPSGGYKVSMACSAWEHFSGGASTFVMATKINSESLRADIENLKVQIAAALPGQSVPLDLDEASIAAMVAEADAIDVLNEDAS